MDSNIKLCIERAENELILARAVKYLSDNSTLKKESFNIGEDITFYSAVISHAYYSIFYSAKAYLISKNESLPEQGQHQAAYYKFKKFVKNGSINTELLNIYEDVKIKAKYLLEILENEEENRTIYTYNKLPQANKEPAEGSLNNARIFFSHMKEIIKGGGRNV
ncbi:MAG: hypothetical protein Q7R87_03200 [Nanoarchaeota archaeon]|nr:hypothetical protein [Nanoarchaeota archaeon]